MKNVYFTAGPSQIYPTVPSHLENAIKDEVLSMSHRGENFKKLFTEVRKNLQKLLQIPDEHHIFFLSSANEAWEKIIENCVTKYSFHFVNGAFSAKCFEYSGLLNKKPESVVVDHGKGFNFSNVKIPKHTELVCLTHNESSTGVALPMDEVHQLKKRERNKLFALDVVSSIPYVNIDYSLIDCVYFSVQKGFGLPAGMGVLILSPAAIKKSQTLQDMCYNIGSYHSFPMLLKFAQKNQTPETPNVLNMYLLNKVIKDMLRIGIERIRKQTDEKAEIMYAFFEKHKKYKPFVKNKKDRSATLIVAETAGETEAIVDRLKKKHMIVGKGYGDNKKTHIRIANFPAHTLDDIKRLLAII